MEFDSVDKAHQCLLTEENSMRIAVKLTEEKRRQCHVRDLDVLHLLQDRDLQGVLAPRIFRVVRSYLHQVKALDELLKH